MDIWNKIHGFEKLSLCDWKGHHSAVLFTGGCNLKCPTCHNQSLAFNPRSVEPISRESVMPYLQSYQGWLDGVVITGGEPTILPGLPELIREIRGIGEGYKINLHTNGLKPETIRFLMEEDLVDVFSVDVKGPWQMYPALTGNKVTPEKAQASLEAIFDLAKNDLERFYFRTTVVPVLNEDHLKDVRAYLPAGTELHLQEYREPQAH